MQHMQIVQPKIKQIQQKYKGNKQRQQEEIMKLYKEYGVNPFSGCWPVLLQFPILIAMYSVLRCPQHPIHIPDGQQAVRGRHAADPRDRPGRRSRSPRRRRSMPLDLPGPVRRDLVPRDEPAVLGDARRQPGCDALGPRTSPNGQNLAYPVELRDDGDRSHPLLRVRRADVRDDLLPAAPDAEGEPARRLVLAAAGAPEGHADHVRRLRHLLPRRAGRATGRRRTRGRSASSTSCSGRRPTAETLAERAAAEAGRRPGRRRASWPR